MNTALPRGAFSKSLIRGSTAPRSSPASPAPPALLVRLLFAIFFILDFPAFTFQLALDPTTGQWTGSQFTAVATLTGELFALAVILTSREITRLALRCWPILVLIAVAFASAAWSRNPKATIDVSIRFAGTALLGVALAGKMPHFQGVRFVVRTMTFGCALSIVWVFIFPETAVHQATDVLQSVHAGLWRGIFSHKQGLGLFAGLTVGLLLFYRTLIFPPTLLPLAIACSLICLIGTQSATGIVAVVLTPVLLLVGRAIVLRPSANRKAQLVSFSLIFATIAMAYELGLLNFVIVQVLGKSTDLTGRADFWPITLENFRNSGSSLLGGGFGAGFAADLSEWSVDNGYIDKLIEFGYVISPIIYASYAAIIFYSLRLLLKTPVQYLDANVFPFGIVSVVLITNITESNFMTKSFCTVLTSVAAALIFEARNQTPKGQKDRAIATTSRAVPSLPPSRLAPR